MAELKDMSEEELFSWILHHENEIKNIVIELNRRGFEICE